MRDVRAAIKWAYDLRNTNCPHPPGEENRIVGSEIARFKIAVKPLGPPR